MYKKHGVSEGLYYLYDQSTKKLYETNVSVFLKMTIIEQQN